MQNYKKGLLWILNYIALLSIFFSNNIVNPTATSSQLINPVFFISCNISPSNSFPNIKVRTLNIKPNVISIIYNKDNTEILNKVLNTTPDSIIIFYGNLGEKKDLYNSYDVCIYSSIVATKLDSNKIINHYSDIIEEEINSEENNEDNKIYVLIPK